MDLVLVRESLVSLVSLNAIRLERLVLQGRNMDTLDQILKKALLAAIKLRNLVHFLLVVARGLGVSTLAGALTELEIA